MIRKIFGFDARAIALYRIMIGIIVCWDVILRWRDIEGLYSDDGGVTRNLIASSFPSAIRLSVYNISGSAFFTECLFVLTAFMAIFLILGFKPKLTLFALWILTVSLHTRNPFVLNDGDLLLRIYMFWGLFLPLGEKLDSKSVLNVGTVGFVIQIAWVYFATALLKTGPAWHHNGTALSIALGNSEYTTAFGTRLLAFPGILKLTTWSVYYFEVMVPLLLVLSAFHHRFRSILIAVALLFHLGIWFCMNIGVFPWACIAGWLLLIPGELFEKMYVFIGARRNDCDEIVGQVYEPSKLGLRQFALATVTAICLLYVSVINARSVLHPSQHVSPVEWWDTLGRLCRIDQRWGMFAPTPRPGATALLFVGRLNNGRVIDLVRRCTIEVSASRPGLEQGYVSQRWRSYYGQLASKRGKPRLNEYVKYLARTWNAGRAEEQLLQKVTVMKAIDLPIAVTGTVRSMQSVIYDQTIAYSN